MAKQSWELLKLKKSPEEFNNRFDMAEERTHELQGGSKEIIQSEKQRKKNEKNEQSHIKQHLGQH